MNLGYNIRMKQWPKEITETAGYEDLIDPVRNAFDQLYTKRRKKAKSATYDGFPTTEAHIVSQPSVRLSEESLEQEAFQGRDPLDVILNIAFNLGMEQGQRALRNDLKNNLLHLDSGLSILKHSIDSIRYKVTGDRE